MHKLEVTLKQHTPLIHFQHEQEGATLRASEVKPKLDRFIIEKLGGFDEVKKNHSDWFAGKGEHGALDYKMNIVSTIKKYIDWKKNPNPTYFGNQGQNIDKKEPKRYDDNILIIKLYNENLKEELKRYIPVFFINNTFASRQTKGNGCYTVTEIKDQNEIIKHKFEESMLENCLGKIENVPKDSVFIAIETYWKLLKSGINAFYINPPIYEKPFIINQLNGNTWDKAWLKQNLLNSSPVSTNAVFARALLGLPETITFRSHTKKYKLYDDYVVNIKNNQVERIKSPIIFKPINNKY